MTPEMHVLLSGALTFGVPLAIAVRELMVLKRGGKPDDRRPRRPTPKPLAPSDGRPKLPDCLIPKPLPQGLVPRLPTEGGDAPAPRRRELEPA
jgi:hypothetical protein